jgi:hypothetical protein
VIYSFIIKRRRNARTTILLGPDGRSNDPSIQDYFRNNHNPVLQMLRPQTRRKKPKQNKTPKKDLSWVKVNLITNSKKFLSCIKSQPNDST